MWVIKILWQVMVIKIMEIKLLDPFNIRTNYFSALPSN